MKNFKRLIAGAIGACILAAGVRDGSIYPETVFVKAETVSDYVTGFCGVDSVSWKYDRSSGVLYIAGDGEILAIDSLEKYKNNVKEMIIDGDVTSIPYECFAGLKNLESVKINSKMKDIQHYAFKDCTKLKTVELNDGLTYLGKGVFENCTNLTSIKLGSKLETAYPDVFEGCTSLESIPCDTKNNINVSGLELSMKKRSGISGQILNSSGTKIISETTYSYNQNTKTLTIAGAGVMTDGFVLSEPFIGETTYNFLSGSPDKPYIAQSVEHIIIGNKVTKIGDYAFYGCKNLKSVKIGNSLTEIGKKAFASCTSLTSVTFGKKNFKIDASAFENCTKLKTLGNSSYIVGIGTKVFSGCKSLTSFKIGKNLKKISTYPFYNCSKLKKFTISSSNKYFTVKNSNLVSKDGKTLVSVCYGASSTCKIPEKVKKIDVGVLLDTGVKAFSVEKGNKSFKAIKGALYSKDGKSLYKVPSKITGIFSVNSATTSIVGYAGKSAFTNCDKLTKIEVGSKVSKIETNGLSLSSSSVISINSNNKHFYESDGCIIDKSSKKLLYAYKQLPQTYTIPSGVDSVDSYAFSAQESMTDGILYNKEGTILYHIPYQVTSYVMPDSLVKMDKNVDVSMLEELITNSRIQDISDFLGFETGLKKLYIGKEVSIVNCAIAPFLEEITVDSENKTFKSIDGVLYSKDGTSLLWCPAKKSGTIMIPEGTVKIDNYAFFKANCITDIIFPKTVTALGENALGGQSIDRETDGIVISIPNGYAEYYSKLFGELQGYTTNMTVRELTE